MAQVLLFCLRPKYRALFVFVPAGCCRPNRLQSFCISVRLRKLVQLQFRRQYRNHGRSLALFLATTADFFNSVKIYSMRILILNLSDNSAAEVNDALAGQGYEIVSESALDVEQIQALGPEHLVTEETPSDLICCEHY